MIVKKHNKKTNIDFLVGAILSTFAGTEFYKKKRTNKQKYCSGVILAKMSTKKKKFDGNKNVVSAKYVLLFNWLQNNECVSAW